MIKNIYNIELFRLDSDFSLFNYFDRNSSMNVKVSRFVVIYFLN